MRDTGSRVAKNNECQNVLCGADSWACCRLIVLIARYATSANVDMMRSQDDIITV